jgi:hypothetical protein
VGRRQRQRQKLAGQGRQSQPAASVDEYRDADGNVLRLRGSLSPAARGEYGEVLDGGTDREDAWQRAAELLFERLAVSWTIAGLEITSQKELLGRYRMATGEERRFVREALRAHACEHFPELEAP